MPCRPLPTALLLALMVLALAGVGCSSVVIEPGNPDQPVTVYVLSEGIHTGLVLPQDSPGFIEYAYGDWGWYAEGKVGFFEVFPTTLWETQGALGRRLIHLPAGTGEPTRQDLLTWHRDRTNGNGGGTVRLSPVHVPRARMVALRQRLEQQFAAARAAGPEKPQDGFVFVHHPAGYWLGWNCADVTAEWLRELGCRVTPALFRTSLSVAGQPRDLSTDDGK